MISSVLNTLVPFAFVFSVLSSNTLSAQELPTGKKGVLKANGKIVETTATSIKPLGPVVGNSETFFLPSRVNAGFGAYLTANQRQLSKQVGFAAPMRGVSRNRAGVVKEIAPACGPSPRVNTLACYNLIGGEALGESPTPGAVSTVPVFQDGAWFVGTSKGVFFSIGSLSEKNTPFYGDRSAEYWGNFARSDISSLKVPEVFTNTVEGSSSPAEPAGAPKPKSKSQKQAGQLPNGWKWSYVGASEFIGKPVIQGGSIYVLSASQFLHAFEMSSGKLIWAVRLAPETTLRLSSAALAVSTSEIIVGTPEGMVAAFNAKDGALLWQHAVAPGENDRFKGVVASPVVSGRKLYVSNAESVTQKVSLEERTVDWSYPMGSIAQVRLDDTYAYIGGSDGTVVAVDNKSGVLKWKTRISRSSPIASLVLTKSGYLFVASKSGIIGTIHTESGQLTDLTMPKGGVVGEFFSSPAESEVCLSFELASLKCFLTNADLTN